MSVRKYEGLVTESPKSQHLVFVPNFFYVGSREMNRDCLREASACRNVIFSRCYLGGGPLPRPRPGPAPGPGIGPRPLGPGGWLTGPRALGLGDARATSFCRLTPLPADPGFVLVGFDSGSGVFSV